MTKDDLEQIKGLKSEIKAIQEDLQNLPVTKDSVTGSMVDYPYIKRTMVISGIDESKGKLLRRKLERKLDELQDMLLEMENWLDSVEDAEMRTILRLKCRNGMTNKQIASELGYDKSTITKKINKLIEKK